jgi:hypothetical protein
MSSIAASLQPVPRRQYVSTGIFTANFFTYGKAAVVNGVQRYALTQVSEDDNDCPKGHILRENGRKLIKDVNIDLNDPNTTANEYTYLVGVIDTTADPAVAGFIDPNCPLFSTFNTDKPYFLDSPLEAEDAATGLQDIGAPVYTRGDITTTAGNITATAGLITAGDGLNVTGKNILNRSLLAVGTTTTSTTLSTANANYLAGGYITQTATTGAQNLILPSTAAIVAALGSTVGASSDFIYWNAGTQTVTITRGDVNTTVVGTATANNLIVKFTVVVAGVSGDGSVYVIRSS